MASLKEVKERINSVSSTEKITSAMKMVASAKLHKAQAAIGNMYPYEQKLSGILSCFLDGESASIQSPYVEKREVKRVAVVAFSSNSSLCGAFNSTVIRQLLQMLEGYRNLGRDNVLVYPIGRKVADAVKKMGWKTEGDYQRMAEHPSYAETSAFASQLMDLFVAQEVDKVEFVYNHFRSTSVQVLTQETFLPVDLEKVQKDASGFAVDYIVEPSPKELVESLLPKVLRLKVYTVLLDSNAAEHAARMIAMQAATDNADDLLQELTVAYNKSRQQAITNELLDIIGGSMK